LGVGGKKYDERSNDVTEVWRGGGELGLKDEEDDDGKEYE